VGHLSSPNLSFSLGGDYDDGDSALGGPGLLIWGRLAFPPPWASDVVLNFPPYLIKILIGLN
jgi:hypothetical protein